jgi:hypothetical protein
MKSILSILALAACTLAAPVAQGSYDGYGKQTSFHLLPDLCLMMKNKVTTKMCLLRAHTAATVSRRHLISPLVFV